MAGLHVKLFHFPNDISGEKLWIGTYQFTLQLFRVLVLYFVSSTYASGKKFVKNFIIIYSTYIFRIKLIKQK
jgi:hypothetical protein